MKIPWKQIEQLPHDEPTTIKEFVCTHHPATRFEIEHLTAFRPDNPSILYRRVKNPNGNWSNIQELQN